MRSSGVEVSRACVVEHLKSPWFIVELTLGTQVSVTVPILDQRIERTMMKCLLPEVHLTPLPCVTSSMRFLLSRGRVWQVCNDLIDRMAGERNQLIILGSLQRFLFRQVAFRVTQLFVHRSRLQ